MSDIVSYKILDIESTKPICEITMDDGKANAVSPKLVEELNQAFDQAEKDKAIVILSGREGKFSAGFDLSVMNSGDMEQIVLMLKGGSEFAERIINFPYPVIIANTGHCMAMGALFLLSADYRIGIEGNFKIGLNETKIGMVMPDFGCAIARHALTPKYLRRCLINAEILTPETAVAADFLDECVAPDQLKQRAIEKALECTELDMMSFFGIKHAINKAASTALRAAIEKDYSA